MLASFQLLGQMQAAQATQPKEERQTVGRKRKRENDLPLPAAVDAEEPQPPQGKIRAFLSRLMGRGPSDSPANDENDPNGSQAADEIEGTPVQANCRSDANSPITSVSASTVTALRRPEVLAKLDGPVVADESCLPLLEYDEVLLEQLQLLRSIPSEAGPLVLPPKEAGAPAVTLVLDLDETLVHSALRTLEGESFRFSFEKGENEFTISTKFRPGVREFFQAIEGRFELVIFTASQEAYAGVVIDELEKLCRGIDFKHHRLYRDSCTAVQTPNGVAYVKDLSRLGRPLEQTIIVDNNPSAFAYDLNGGVPIVSWFGEDYDEELEALVPLLLRLSSAADVRPIVHKLFGLQDAVYSASSSPSISAQWTD